jgi:hypothetical protein
METVNPAWTQSIQHGKSQSSMKQSIQHGNSQDNHQVDGP